MKSDLRMQNLHFSECTITRSAVIENGPMTFDLQKDITKSDGGYIVTLTLTINKENNDLNVRVVASANFSMESENETLVKSIMEANTVAIMFPFIRSQVSLLTTQPGMVPIVLPPINTAKFASN